MLWRSTRIMSSLLFEVKATDPITFGSMLFVLLFVALSACLLPGNASDAHRPSDCVAS